MPEKASGLIGLGPAIAARIAEGDCIALLHALFYLAASWTGNTGSPSFDRGRYSMTVAIRDPDLSAEERTLLAAGCDLYDLLTHAPQGRQALQDLLSQPIPHHSESEG